MTKEMTDEQRKKWEEAQEFRKDIAKQAKKECDVEVGCQSCGECIGYANKDLYFEDFLIVCQSCGEANG